MDDSNPEAELDKLMGGHLVYWLKSCLMDADRLQDFSDLVDGPLIYEVLQQIDPERNPSNQIQESHGNQSVRLKNLDIILESLKTIYRDDIGALILASPDIVTLSLYHEHSNRALYSFAAEARLLLVLLLGAAVQCSEKENFILKIKSLPIDIQLGIVENIKEVTENRTVVVNLDGTDMMSADCLTLVTKSRDAYLMHYIELMSRHEHALMAAATSKHATHAVVNPVMAVTGSSSAMIEQHQQTASMHLVVEIADWKSKVRKKDQELEEKCESLLECREELENTKALVSKLKQEVLDLSTDARSAKMYRDELDAVRLKAERCERLESELGRARDKLRELEYLKGLTTELREDNRMLLERTQELEEQLSRSRARSGTVIDLEAQIARFKQTVSDASQEREELQEKVRDLMEENTQLQLRQLSASKLDSKSASQEIDTNMAASGGNSLLDQLASSAQSDVVRLNLENSRLRAELDNIRENLSLEKASLETALENEKKKSAMKVEEILSSERVHRQLQSTLENTVRELTQEKKELGSQLQDSAINSQMLATQLQETKQQVVELSDKVSHLESVQRANEVLLEAEKTRLATCQRELLLTRSENTRLTDNLTVKSANLENEMTKRREFENRSTELKAALKVAKENIQRSAEYEQQVKEYTSKSEMLEDSLKDLQNELYLEKLEKEKISSQFESVFNNLKSIANLDTQDKSWILDKECIIERLSSNDKLIKVLTDHAKNSSENMSEKSLQNQETTDSVDDNKIQEVAQLQVQVSILESQVSSLQNQQTVQQLANSQLAAEKEELSHQLETQNFQKSQVSADLANLQKIHENLVSEYELLRSEKESCRNELKSCQRELRLATEQINALKVANQDQELLRMEAKTLANLRAEHSKLKEDFRQLFSASERLKMESRSRDDELRRTRIELGNMRVSARQISSALENEKEVNARLSAKLTRTDTKLQLLTGVVNSMDEDRKSLMSHVNSLLGQYHELLSNSMEDKEFFHSQEKIFLERLNGLLRQKENLEQKIMDHYKRLQSCPAKKKAFGSSFVKKVKKAGSEIINKVPRARSRSRITTDEAETSLASESGIRESEHSSDDTVSEHGGIGADSDTDTSLSLGSVGTRRAIYYDDPATTPTSTVPEPITENSESKERNLLVFNKVSAVIGTNSHQTSNIPVSPHLVIGEGNSEEPSEQKTESSVWYEYGKTFSALQGPSSLTREMLSYEQTSDVPQACS